MLDLLLGGLSDGHKLFIHSGLTTPQFGQVLTMLEISGKIRALGNNHWTLT